MAQRTVILLEDDIDGGDATETVAFGLDGTSYEIDLNENNAVKMRDAVAPYVAAARRPGRSAGAPPRARRSGGRPSTATDGQSQDLDPKAVRAWAQQNGVEISARGRISATVAQAYRDATAS